MTLRLRDYLIHISEAISRVQAYVHDVDADAFTRSELIQDGVIRNIEVIGEASRRIQTGYPEFAADHPELPLSAAYQMRNAVAHGYFAVDLEVLWATVHTDLAQLAGVVEVLLSGLPGADGD